MRTLVRVIPAAVLVALTAACLTVGADFRAEPVLDIEKGVTTKEQLREWLGDPYQMGLEDGRETWTYLYVRRNVRGDVQSKQLHIKFDDGGRVETYSYTTNTGDLPSR